MKDTNARSVIGIPMSMDDRGNSGYYDREHAGGYRFRRWGRRQKTTNRRRRRGRDLSDTHKIDDGFIIPRSKPRTRKNKPRNPSRYNPNKNAQPETVQQAGRRTRTRKECIQRCVRSRNCGCSPPTRRTGDGPMVGDYPGERGLVKHPLDLLGRNPKFGLAPEDNGPKGCARGFTNRGCEASG